MRARSASTATSSLATSAGSPQRAAASRAASRPTAPQVGLSRDASPFGLDGGIKSRHAVGVPQRLAASRLTKGRRSRIGRHQFGLSGGAKNCFCNHLKQILSVVGAALTPAL